MHVKRTLHFNMEFLVDMKILMTGIVISFQTIVKTVTWLPSHDFYYQHAHHFQQTQRGIAITFRKVVAVQI